VDQDGQKTRRRQEGVPQLRGAGEPIMASELRSMLTTLLASAGTNKFFFASATGKRKDGKGDGALAIGPKKPVKTDIEDEAVNAIDAAERQVKLPATRPGPPERPEGYARVRVRQDWSAGSRFFDPCSTRFQF
jgi:hypothetical protein